jgi:hypothetical protein
MNSPLSTFDYRPPPAFRMGDVLVRSWSVLSRNLPIFVLLCGLAGLPSLILSAVSPPRVPGHPRHWFFVLELLVGIIPSALAGAVVVHAAFQDLRGREVIAKESLLRGLARSLPAVGLGILLTFGSLLGLACLLVPGLIILAFFAVTTPACVLEGTGVAGSLARSAQLTKNRKWPILGISVASLVVAYLISKLAQVALGPSHYQAAALASWPWQIFEGSFLWVYTAVLYHDLRAAKEEIGAGQIAAASD